MKPILNLKSDLPVVDGTVLRGHWTVAFDHGEIVNAEVYDRELTPEEIKELSNPR